MHDRPVVEETMGPVASMRAFVFVSLPKALLVCFATRHDTLPAAATCHVTNLADDYVPSYRNSVTLRDRYVITPDQRASTWSDLKGCVAFCLRHDY